MIRYSMRFGIGMSILIAAALAAARPAVAHASGVAKFAFSYNDNGNPTLYNGVSPAYNEDDQLTTFGSLTAGYGSDGLRAWKDSGTGRRYFLYAGTTPVCELNADGSVAAVNTFGPTGLLSRRENGQARFYTFDPQGSVSQILDSTGSVSATQLYDAYGTLLHGTASYPYGFGAQYGYYTDQETDLLLLTHRYYDPSEGRFLTRDPIGYAGGMDLYAYCGNNPVNAVDPLGFCGGSGSDTGPPLWYDRLRDKVNQLDKWIPHNLIRTACPQIDDAIRTGEGLARLPSDVGHLGEGAGDFAAKPSWERAPGAIKDLLTFATVVGGAAGLMEAGGSIGAGGLGRHISSNIKDVDALSDINRFLGDGAQTNVNPYTGAVDADRVFAEQADGAWRSVRMGSHEMRNGNNFHYHLEEWDNAIGQLIRPDQSVHVLRTGTR